MAAEIYSALISIISWFKNKAKKFKHISDMLQ